MPGQEVIYVRSKLGKSVISWDDLVESEREAEREQGTSVCMVENVQDWPEDVEDAA